MTENEIALLAPTKEDQLLVSRLQDGSEVRLSKEKILPIVQDRIDELNDEGAHLILIACTGRFPIFTSKVEIIYPDFLLSHVVIGTFMNGTIGVIIPNENQKEMIENKWNKDGFAIVHKASSPYTFSEEKFIQAIQTLEQKEIKTIVLDCFGYTNEMKQLAQKHTEKPIVLSRNIIYKLIAEIIS